MILFVSGFNRSGTTVLQEAVAAATGGAPLTVGDIVRHGSPALSERLRGVLDSPTPVDRGVDRREVTADTPEEYGWLLLDWGVRGPLGMRTSRFEPDAAPHLREVAEELVARSGQAVLKNPSDIGREAVLLESFPEARVILTRRRLGGIMDSSYAALQRLAVSQAYVLALSNNSPWIRVGLRVYRNGHGGRVLRALSRWNLRLRVAGFLRTIPRLPLERVAFLDYDELVADADGATRWAAHILDTGQLAKEFRAAHSIPRHERPPAQSRIDRELDRRWERAWERARKAQVERGILPG